MHAWQVLNGLALLPRHTEVKMNFWIMKVLTVTTKRSFSEAKELVDVKDHLNPV